MKIYMMNKWAKENLMNFSDEILKQKIPGDTLQGPTEKTL